MWVTRLLFLAVICLYSAIFFFHTEETKAYKTVLQPTLPSSLQLMISSYARQLMAESLYIKVVVFLGGHPLPEEDFYKDNLHQHFVTIQRLHPHLVDTYYMSESSLAWISRSDAINVNKIMATGIPYKKDEWVLFFFKGFNEFHYLDDSVTAAHTLYASTAISTAPSWLARLATVLSAKGGELKVGLSWLHAMLQGEDDEQQKKRYRKDIVTFKKAMAVQDALKRYKHENQSWPKSLDELVPGFISKLPDIKGDKYELLYKDEALQLRRTR